MSGKPRFSYDMAVLERIMQMKQQGIPEGQITQTLQQEGISPREVNEALSQSKIKSAVSPGEQMATPNPGIPQGAEAPAPPGVAPPAQPGAPMQASIGSPEQAPQEMPPQGAEEAYPEQPGAPMQASMGSPEQAQAPPQEMPPQGAEEAYPEQPEAYPPAEGGYDQYGGQGGYQDYQQPAQGADIETMNDIAEQIVEEKTTKLKKQVSTFTKFKDDIDLEVKKINERLTKLENTFNELQMAVLKKVGEFGEDIKNISKEMHANQDSFSKIINPLTDNLRKTQEPTEKETKPKTRTTKKTKKSAGFEDYLRE